MRYQSARDMDSHVTLGAFEEIRGQLETIQQDDSAIYIGLSSGTLRFPVGTPEAKLCKRELHGQEGADVAILRVPVGERPLRIKIEDHHG